MPAPGAINPKTGKRFAWEEEQRRLKEQSTEHLEAQLALYQRQQAAVQARERFMTFVKFTSPDPEDPNDVTKSKYKNAKHHDAIARVIEEVEKGGIQFLILTMPPRHGKSELVSRRLPAWYAGRHPDQNIVVATYNDDFAADFGKEVRTIMQTPQYRQVFPGVALKRGGAASDRLQTTQGGQLSFVGRGGSLTGRGAHCFPASTQVMTRRGLLSISAINVGQEVLSYDERNGRIVWRRVQAIQVRPRSGLLRITTTAGRVVEATSDHRFYANGRWIEAGQLTAGDRLVCAVRDHASAISCGGDEERTSGSDKFLLQQSVLGRWRKCAQIWRARLRSMWRKRAKEGFRRFAGEGQNLLLQGVPGTGAVGRIRTAGAFANEAVCALQLDVHAGEFSDAVLQQTVRVQSARRANGKNGQPALERRGVGQQGKTSRYSTVPRAATDGHEAGRAQMRALRRDGETGSPSHRRGSVEQQGVEPCDALSRLPREGALFGREDDFVATVEDARRSALVYDIQVEETECFFADGILAHNCLICDDLIKDDKEAQSQAIRDQAWNWLVKVAMTRRMGKKLVILTFTRWHNDDPIGRLTDPENQHFNRKLAEKIKIINLPAIAEEDDPLGRKAGEPLWADGPDKFDLDFLEEQRSLDPLGFAALYQQRPSLLDGDLFRRENIQFYGPGTPNSLPDNLRFYASSDHAVGMNQRNDPSCFLKVGISPQNDIYLVACDWRKMPTDVAVESMLTMCSDNMRPLIWFAERGHISKSIGPFLRKRMLETNIFINIREMTPVVDKAQRAQSIAARVAMGKVYFPLGALWTERAINEMMAFPNGTHDDFVDALAWIGLGLGSQFAPSAKRVIQSQQRPEFGTLAWVKQNDKWAKEQREIKAAGGF